MIFFPIEIQNILNPNGKIFEKQFDTSALTRKLFNNETNIALSDN